MLVKQDQVNPCEVELQIEVEVEKVNAAVSETYKELGKKVNIPGFRKGKAPKAVLEHYLSEDDVKERAADKLMDKAYREALEESKLEPYYTADVEVTKFEIGEPLQFKATVPLAPKVELGKYKELSVEKNVAKVTDDDLTNEINGFLDRQAKVEEVKDRPAKDGDVVLIETKNNSDENEEPKRHVANVGKNLPDFDKGLIGMNIGDEKVIDVTYPDDYSAEDLRGKTLPIYTKLIEINEKHVPELTDEWVKSTLGGEKAEGKEPSGDAVETVDQMRAKVKDAMEKAAVEAADNEVKNKIVEMIVSSSKVDFPKAMVDIEVRERLSGIMKELKERKVSFEEYLKYKNTTFEDMRKQYEEDAKKMLTTSLALREVVDKEKITVEDADVDAEIKSIADEQGVPVETIKAYLDKTDTIQDIRNRILQKKLLDFLVNASNIKNVGQ